MACLLDCAYRTSIRIKQCISNLKKITGILFTNGYSLLFIHNQIRCFLNNKLSDLNLLKKNDEQATHLTLRLLLAGNTSHPLQSKIFFSSSIVRKI